MKAKLHVTYHSGHAVECSLDLEEKHENEDNTALILPPLNWAEVKELILKPTEYDETD